MVLANDAAGPVKIGALPRRLAYLSINEGNRHHLQQAELHGRSCSAIFELQVALGDDQTQHSCDPVDA